MTTCALEGRKIPEFKSAREQSVYIEVTGDMGNCHTNVDKLNKYQKSI